MFLQLELLSHHAFLTDPVKLIITSFGSWPTDSVSSEIIYQSNHESPEVCHPKERQAKRKPNQWMKCPTNPSISIAIQFLVHGFLRFTRIEAFHDFQSMELGLLTRSLTHEGLSGKKATTERPKYFPCIFRINYVPSGVLFRKKMKLYRRYFPIIEWIFDLK